MTARNIVLFACFVAITNSTAFAQAASSSSIPSKLEVPALKVKTGVIASSGTRMGGGSDGVVNVQTTDSTPGDALVAVSGGVSNLGDECIANLQNSDPEKGYRVRFDVIGRNERGTQVLRKPYSGTIAPSGKLSKSFFCKSDVSLTLDLKSAEPVK